MKNIWSYVTYLTSFLTLSPHTQDVSQQQVLDTSAYDHGVVAVHNDVTVINVAAPAVNGIVDPSNDNGGQQNVSVLQGPVFSPPTRKEKWAGSSFQCDYRKMEGYEACNTPEDRSCWLRRIDNWSDRYDISTDYESRTPIGTTRDYTLVVEDGQWNADGYWAKDAKLINGTYPGALIQACWGDTLRVKVINKLKHNGTAIHFHGVRQHHTMHMDGVPGITQCPIAPDDYFIYEFKVMQYGDSWYHSHYSVQYADGMLGPVTFHGPTSAHWDEHYAPLLMSDWFHNSAFQVIHEQTPGYPTILLNGTGDITKYQYQDNDLSPPFKITPNAPIPPKYTMNFEPRNWTAPVAKQVKKYLLRLINTSFTTTFVFSIDAHKLTVVETDFVPVEPSTPRKHLQIGIGQRYTVIVEAEPENWWESSCYGSSYWIRTTAVKCFRTTVSGLGEYDNTGILRYNPNDVRFPVSRPWPDPPTVCKDEVGDGGRFVPKLKWDIPQIPKNGNDSRRFGQEFSAHVDEKKVPKQYALAKWAFLPEGDKDKWNPMQVDYSDPFYLQLNNFNQSKWLAKWMVVPASYTEKDWMFLALTGFESRKGTTAVAAHPMHLHGHDFAVLQIEETKEFTPENIKFNSTLPLVRRDVILLPSRGWVVVAFKTDNPGNWLIHCHIAFHASEGLGFQINERQFDANLIWYNDPTHDLYHPSIVEASRVCKRWKDFEDDCTRHWPGKNEKYGCWPACHPDDPKHKMYACPKGVAIPKHEFQDDSGV